MNYRIFFNPETALFEVQILCYGLFWKTAKGMNFPTLNEAQTKISDIGLDRLYANKSADAYRRHMAAA